MWELVLLTVGTIVATAAGAAHLAGWIPPRYRRVIAAIQLESASTIKAGVQEGLKATLTELQAAGQADAEVQGRQLAELLAQGVAAGSGKALEPLEARLEAMSRSFTESVQTALRSMPEAIAPIADRTERALRDGLAALASTITDLASSAAARDLGERSGDARRDKALAQQGARKLLANYASKAGPIASLAATGAIAAGLVDDETIEGIATLLIDNPQLTQQLQAAYATVAGKRGISIGGDGGFHPGLPGR